METNCVTCGKPFTAQRSTARYCSNRCKQAHKNKRYGLVRPETEINILLDALKNLQKCHDKELIRHSTGIKQAFKRLDEFRKHFETLS